MNFKSKGYDGDSKSRLNIPASRGRCKPGTSKKLPNITPEPQPPKHTWDIGSKNSKG